ncbi:unnamed protein product [marine sediment metagenome]|uniref:Uncharacterized protein n=1 Tax=marine sediment metagenome TaxID=412755 RepID=X1E8G7_9ZZZZ
MSGIEIGALTILVSSMVWYLKYQTKRQAIREDKQDKERKEEIVFIRGLVTNDMKELHKDSVKNAELNKDGIVLLKDVNSNQGKLCKLIESIDRRINGREK